MNILKNKEIDSPVSEYTPKWTKNVSISVLAKEKSIETVVKKDKN